MSTVRIVLSAIAAVLCAVAAFSAHARQSARPDQLEFRGLYRELIETNTSHSTGSCTEAAHKMGARLKSAGFKDAELHYFAVAEHPRDGGLVAVMPGTAVQVKALLLLAHLDVVEARREDWTRDPFTLAEEGGYFYGRGAFDDKSMAAVWVDTLVRLRRAGYAPKRTLKVALTCGEESGAQFNGAEYLALHEPQLIDAAFALNEFAWGVLDAAGQRVALEVQVGEKTSQDYVFEVRNPGGHSSRPVKDNAIYHLAAALTRIGAFDFPVELNDITRTYFQRMSDILGGDPGEAMRRLVAHPDDAAAAATLSDDPRLNALLRTTCVATLLSAGHATNALPQRASANINCRLLPGDSVEEVRRRLSEVAADPAITVSLADPPDPVAAPPPLTPAIMKPIEAAAREVYPGVAVVPVLQAAGTDAVHLIRIGIPTYGVSGMFVDPDLSNVHGRDERIRVRSLYDGRDFLYSLVRRYAEESR